MVRARGTAIRVKPWVVSKHPRDCEQIAHVVREELGRDPPEGGRLPPRDPHQVCNDRSTIDLPTGKPGETRGGADDAPRDPRDIARRRVIAPPANGELAETASATRGEGAKG
eukprot:3382460-Alexandrium_andersonii.AAC.1